MRVVVVVAVLARKDEVDRFLLVFYDPFDGDGVVIVGFG